MRGPRFTLIRHLLVPHKCHLPPGAGVKRHPGWGALFYLAAGTLAAVAAQACAAAVVVAAAAAAEQNDQNDDPPNVIAVTHNRYLRKINS